MTHRIVVVGGGTGGTVLANRLADELADDVDDGAATVTLVDDGPDHVYKPVFLYVPFGTRTVDDGRRPLRDLLDPRVDLRVDRATGLDTDARRVTLRDGDALDYDSLVLATGTRLAPEAISGLAEGGHHFYGADGAERLRDALAAFSGGRLVVSVAGRPHMCPAAPVEFAFMADAWLREQGLARDTDLVYTYPTDGLHGNPAIDEWVRPRFADRGVETHTGFVVESVDPDAGVVAAADGATVDYDLLVSIPPHRGRSLVTDVGLGDEDGWVEVDQHTLEATGAKHVTALGDAAALPVPKAGSAAHYQAGVVASRLASRVRGQVPTARYDGKTVCFLEAGLDEATYVSFDYETDPVLPGESRFVHWAKLAYNESYWLTARGVL